MKVPRLALVLSAAILPLLPAAPCQSAPQLELYGTFHAMGIIVQLSPDDPDGDVIAQVAYRTTEAVDPYRLGYSLTRSLGREYLGQEE
jgi:hypothetical protein